MLTKDEERAVLLKIKKLIDQTGDSYIAKAFEGCCDLAEQNIDNDFWMSMKDRADVAQADRDAMAKEYHAIEMDRDDLIRQLDVAKRDYETAKRNASEFEEDAKELAFLRDEWQTSAVKVQEDNDMLRSQITELKAKLYDYMAQ